MIDSLFFDLADDTWQGLGAAEGWQERSRLGRLGMVVATVPLLLLGLVLQLVWGALTGLAQSYAWAHDRIPGSGLALGLGAGWGILQILARDLPKNAPWESFLELVTLGLVCALGAAGAGALAHTWRRASRFNSVSLALALGGAAVLLFLGAWRILA